MRGNFLPPPGTSLLMADPSPVPPSPLQPLISSQTPVSVTAQPAHLSMPVERAVRHWPPLTGIVPVPALLADFRSLLHYFRYAAERLRVGDKRRPLRVSFARLPSAPSLDHFCGHSLKRCAFDGLCNGSRTDLCGVISVDVLRLAQSWCVCHFFWHRAGVDVLWLAQSWSGCPLVGTELEWMSFAWHRAGVDVHWLAQSWSGCPLLGTELEWMSFAWHRAGVGVLCLAQSLCECLNVLSLAQSYLSQRRMDIAIHSLLQPPACAGNLES